MIIIKLVVIQNMETRIKGQTVMAMAKSNDHWTKVAVNTATRYVY